MKAIITIIPCLLLLLLKTCSYNSSVSSSGQSVPTRIEYQVNIPAMNQEAMFVEMDIPQWTVSDSVHLLAPPIYADNPQLTQTGINFYLVSATNSAGEEITMRKDSCKVGVFNSLSLSFPADQCPVTIIYYVKFLYASHAYMPLPSIDESSGYLEGNYMFLLPYNNTQTVHIWRDTQFDFHVTYNRGSSVSLFGDPDTSVTFDTPYQLMFSKSVLLSASAAASQVLYNGEAVSQPFRIVSKSGSTLFTQDLINKTARDFITILRDVTPGFGTVSDVPYTIITGMNDGIGFEGPYAFCLLNPKEDDTMDVAMTMAHEYVHTWIGIYVGDYDDPWWKEGTATYLGIFIPKRNNLVSYAYTKEGLVRDLSAIPHMDEYIISDPQVRSLLYQYDLAPYLGAAVYQKGAMINMILDRYIREVSGNTTSLIDILAEFVNQFHGRAFHRNEYISFLNHYSGGDVQDIFAKYVDSPGAIPMPVLEENFNAMVSFGAFGEVDTLSRTYTGPDVTPRRNPFACLWENAM